MAVLLLVAMICLAVCALCLIAARITGDVSWVDRLWSILPVGYSWVFAGLAGFLDARLSLMAVLVTLWGVRLTFNLARKGGYSGHEDYRWAVLRARMTPRGFLLFTIGFITLFQNLVLLLITMPAFSVLRGPSGPLGILDLVLCAMFLAFLAGETIADEQQWRFQSAKAARLAAGEAPGQGFLTTGLFRFSRHPNFFFEQAQWWVFAMFAVVATGVVPWTVIGAVLLTGLFIGSTLFTEAITNSKYPDYAQYQASTSAIIPWFPLRRPAVANG